MHGIDIGLAFLEGLALIVSPCILPVLPLVLAEPEPDPDQDEAAPPAGGEAHV